MKRIRVTIDGGIDDDCNMLTRDFDILNAQRVYKDLSSDCKIKIIPFKSDQEITIELDRPVLEIQGIEI